MQFETYISDINKRYETGTAREHTYRPTLQNLLEDIIPNIIASNDPARIDCGAPDFILTRRNIDVGYIEAKDIGDDLDKTEKSEQLKRYSESLDNLILTDYLEYRFFINSEKVETIRIGEVRGNHIRPLPENFDRLKALLIDFAAFQGQTIRSAKKLAEMMAHKARLMRDVFFKVVEDKNGDSTLREQLKAFQTVLVHDMDEEQFADVYAQTIAYGLFTARLHDPSLEDFSRSEALILIPKSNPFLRQLFHYVAGPDLDDRVVWIVDALCEVYRATDLREILKDFGTATGQNDPILHFYETFLAEYDPKLRKSRGVFYTPEPVVNFIVRAIDDVLKTHFGLSDGLANNVKVEIEVDTETVKNGKRQKEKKAVHKVQLLDIATGTGTFLAEVIKQIYNRFRGQEGLWSSYVDNDLLPRLHGFELLMASYAMCHMKLDLLLRETGYRPSDPNMPPRVSVYLTNSLEEHHPDMDTLFASWLSHEANAASRIKKDMPIMVAFGNPPYSISSSNRGEWIQNLVSAYKQGLNETNINALSDDYIKFVRLAEYYIEKTGYGIVAMITNNSFYDGTVHRQMRDQLIRTFDHIYIFDLHGDVKKRESTHDGKGDKNVFDIQQGVGISVFVKSELDTRNRAIVKYYDIHGSREDKYLTLQTKSILSDDFKSLEFKPPQYFFVRKNWNAYSDYEAGFKINDLFMEYNAGIQTKRDKLFTDFDTRPLSRRIQTLLSGDFDYEFITKYNISDSSSYRLLDKMRNASNFNSAKIVKCTYRPFDQRMIYYDPDLLGRAFFKTMQHMLDGDNLGLIVNRQSIGDFSYVGVTRNITIHGSFYLGNRGQDYICPLYLMHKDVLNEKTPNLKPEIYSKLKKLTPDIKPESLFDYIYAVMHSPAYRQRYAEFLNSDFPRIPYPKDAKTFKALAKKGGLLRELHLMDSEKLNDLITTYPVEGNHEVKKPRYEKNGKSGKVWINELQYFGNVPEIAWNFYIGGYQPAQKWLKDRKGRKLTIEDIKHWQCIIIALTETDKIMQQIDKIDFLPK